MNNDKESLAIKLALNCEWEEAINVNKEIVKDDPENVDALNRLARAYFETGDTKKAISTSESVIKIAPSNQIALRSIKKFKTAKVNSVNGKVNTNASDFIEEPGKTKIVSLINLGQEKTISCLDSGDEAIINAHQHRVSVTTLDGKNIGKFPDDISAKLRLYIHAGSKYKAIVKVASKSNVKIFVKEIKRAEKYKNVNPFPRDPSELESA